MKTKLTFGIIAVLGALALYLFEKEELAISFVAIVWGVYEKFTKEKVKKENKALHIMYKAQKKLMTK